LKKYLKINNQILGALGETYCRQFLYSENIACVRPGSIDAKNLMSCSKILFDYNWERIEVAVPEAIRGELYKMGKTATKYKPRYLYDFLALRLNAENPPRRISQAEVEDFMWVEAKSGNSKPSKAQIQGKSQTKIRVMICRAEGVLLNRPEDVGIDFYEL